MRATKCATCLDTVHFVRPSSRCAGKLDLRLQAFWDIVSAVLDELNQIPFKAVKPRPNDRNISTQHTATLLSTTCCNRLATLLQYVAACCVLLAQVWKWSNFSANIFDVAWCCTRLATVVQHCCTWACARVLFSISKYRAIQHVATYCNKVAKRVQHAVSNNVAVCRVEMLRAFGQPLHDIIQQCCDLLRWNVATVWPGFNEWSCRFACIAKHTSDVMAYTRQTNKPDWRKIWSENFAYIPFISLRTR